MNEISFRVVDGRLRQYGLPERATTGAAAFDLRAIISEQVELAPDQSELIGAGFAIAIPFGYAGLIMPKSGLGSRGLVVGNLVGLIDSDYRGEVKVSVWNRSSASISIEPGSWIAQMAVVPVHTGHLVEQDSLPSSDRGEGGFGSTGSGLTGG